MTTAPLSMYNPPMLEDTFSPERYSVPAPALERAPLPDNAPVRNRSPAPPTEMLSTSEMLLASATDDTVELLDRVGAAPAYATNESGSPDTVYYPRRDRTTSGSV
jgi:hypothetical protein